MDVLLPMASYLICTDILFHLRVLYLQLKLIFTTSFNSVVVVYADVAKVGGGTYTPYRPPYSNINIKIEARQCPKE